MGEINFSPLYPSMTAQTTDHVLPSLLLTIMLRVPKMRVLMASKKRIMTGRSDEKECIHSIVKDCKATQNSSKIKLPYV
jgi:hypothetical protein